MSDQVVVTEVNNQVAVSEVSNRVEVTEETVKVIAVATQGDPGPPGPQGPSGDKTYTQSFIAATTVTVTHNLGKRPAVTVEDSTGREVEGAVQHIDENTLTVTFTAAFSGKVICN